jgi:hypothetical protein
MRRIQEERRYHIFYLSRGDLKRIGLLYGRGDGLNKGV